MRIGLITPGFSASEDDWCIPVLLNLVREIAQEHDVHIFTLRYPHDRRSYHVYRAAVDSFGGGINAGLRRLPLLVKALVTLVSTHRHRPFDVLHGLWADEPGFLAAVAGHLIGVPSLVSVLGGELVGMPEIGYGGQLSHINRWLIQFAIQKADFVTAGSKYLGDIVRSKFGDKRIGLLPLGVDLDMFHPELTDNTPRVEDGYILLNVGSLSEVKDQATLLRGFALITKQKPNVHLHLVGDGPLRQSLEGLAASLDVSQQVTFHGKVSHERLRGYYQSSDLCVTSSRYESQGMVVLEAAACGLPIVGTAVGLLPELEGGSITVPVEDHKALAKAILHLLENDDRRIKMGRTARRLVEERFSLNQTVESLLNANQRLIAQKTLGKLTY